MACCHSCLVALPSPATPLPSQAKPPHLRDAPLPDAHEGVLDDSKSAQLSSVRVGLTMSITGNRLVSAQSVSDSVPRDGARHL